MNRRRNFSLKALLLLVTLAACVFGWMGIRLRQARQQRIAVSEFIRTGGVFEYDSKGSQWLRSLLGSDFFDSPTSLYLYNSRNTSKQLPQLGTFKKSLRWLGLGGSTIANADLRYVGQMTELQYLNLRATDITDDGVKHLEPLTQMKGLDLMGCPVSDTSVPLLSCFKNLEYLDVCGTRLSRNGIAQLHVALPDSEIRSGQVVRIDTEGDAIATRCPSYRYLDGGNAE